MSVWSVQDCFGTGRGTRASPGVHLVLLHGVRRPEMCFHRPTSQANRKKYDQVVKKFDDFFKVRRNSFRESEVQPTQPNGRQISGAAPEPITDDNTSEASVPWTIQMRSKTGTVIPPPIRFRDTSDWTQEGDVVLVTICYHYQLCNSHVLMSVLIELLYLVSQYCMVYPVSSLYSVIYQIALHYMFCTSNVHVLLQRTMESTYSGSICVTCMLTLKLRAVFYVGHCLTYEHVHLTSYSKMKVNLAAQVFIYNCNKLIGYIQLL